MVRRIARRFADAVAWRVAELLATGQVAAPAGTGASRPGEPGPDGAYSSIELDYPIVPRRRYGGNLAPHPELSRLFSSQIARVTATLNAIAATTDQMAAIDLHADPNGIEPYWENGWLPGLDGAALYGLVASRRPAVYLEVGSGNSTKFVARAVRDHSLTTRIVSIDPHPRAEVDSLCHEVVRKPFESVDLSSLPELSPGDVVFVDNSHRSFMNSDVTVAFLELLPRVPSGVLIGFHDITLPEDYPAEWANRFYNEQYVLAAFLLGGHAGFDVVLPAYWAYHGAGLASALDPLWDRVGLDAATRHGAAFWLQRR